MRFRWVALAFVLLVAAACEKQSVARVIADAPGPAPAEAARSAMASRDWVAAAPLFRQAIAKSPDDIALHYDLAICASYLDLRDEAAREFQWVLVHAAIGSEEAQVARRWLADAGGVAASPVTSNQPAPVSDPNDPRTGDGSVHGVVRWAEPGERREQPLNRKLLHLVGLKNTPTHGLRYNVRSDENGRYEFTNIVAGPYKLTDAIAGEPMWRLKITVSKAQEAAVDLDTQNSAKVRDDFPEKGPS
jgi:hypothetical protein